jgi:hypothetical protein
VVPRVVEMSAPVETEPFLPVIRDYIVLLYY